MPKKSTKSLEEKAVAKTVKKVVKKAPKIEAELKPAKKTADIVSVDVPAKAEPKKQVKASKSTKSGNNDTGSIDFQIKNFTGKITVLTKHLREHAHDFDSRRGLLIMVGKRRRLLNYLRKNEPEKYLGLIKKLKLKR